MRRMYWMLLNTLSLLWLFAGCESKPLVTPEEKPEQMVRPFLATGTPEEIARKTVEHYNQLLSKGYATLNMTSLQEVASEEVARRAYHHMAAIGEGGARMLSQLKSIYFSEIILPGQAKCRVRTREVWDFSYQEIASGKALQEVKDFTYQVRYTLENRRGRWMITEITAAGEENRKSGPSWEQLFGQGSQGHASGAGRSSR